MCVRVCVCVWRGLRKDKLGKRGHIDSFSLSKSSLRLELDLRGLGSGWGLGM